MPRALWAEVIRDSWGNPIPGARVEVRDPGGSGPTGAVLYASWAGAEQLPQPLVANAQGCVWFYTAAPGTFDLYVWAAGYEPQVVAGAQTRVSGALDPGLVPVMGPSGPGHGAGLVPDPGATAGTTRYLREDGQWVALLETTAQGPGTVLAGPASGGPGLPTFRALTVGDLPGRSAVSGARLYQQVGQVLGANTWTRIAFDAVSYDSRGEVDLAGARWVAGGAGLYGVSAGVVVVGASAGARYVLSVWVNGGEAARLQDGRWGGAGDGLLGGSTELGLGAGDAVDLRVFHTDSGGRMTYPGPAFVYLTVSLRWRG